MLSEKNIHHFCEEWKNERVMNFPAKKIDMGLTTLALGCAVFIAIAHNGLFWSSLFQVVDVSSLRGILSIADVFILIAGLLTVLLLTLGIPYVFKPVAVIRSEEHTSELQSPTNLVCRLLLEKKKT